MIWTVEFRHSGLRSRLPLQKDGHAYTVRACPCVAVRERNRSIHPRHPLSGKRKWHRKESCGQPNFKLTRHEAGRLSSGRQSEKNGGELVMLSPKDKVESLSTPLNDLSSDGKDTTKASEKKGIVVKIQHRSEKKNCRCLDWFKGYSINCHRKVFYFRAVL